MTSIDIPNSVTSIGGGAFAGCTGLASVVISDNVTIIGDKVFLCGYGVYSGSLETITVGETPPYEYDGVSRYFEITLGNGTTTNLTMYDVGGGGGIK